VAIIPELWEFDGPTDLFSTWTQVIADNAGPVVGAIATIAAGREAGEIVGDGVSMGLPALRKVVTGIFGEAGDRPIGMDLQRVRVDGHDEEREVYTPKVIRLNYASADRLSRENVFGRGRGVIPLEYRDYNRLHGDYTLYVKVERVAAGPIPTPP
jgi:hypothetical protein